MGPAGVASGSIRSPRPGAKARQGGRWGRLPLLLAAACVSFFILYTSPHGRRARNGNSGEVRTSASRRLGMEHRQAQQQAHAQQAQSGEGVLAAASQAAQGNVGAEATAADAGAAAKAGAAAEAGTAAAAAAGADAEGLPNVVASEDDEAIEAELRASIDEAAMAGASTDEAATAGTVPQDGQQLADAALQAAALAAAEDADADAAVGNEGAEMEAALRASILEAMAGKNVAEGWEEEEAAPAGTGAMASAAAAGTAGTALAAGAGPGAGAGGQLVGAAFDSDDFENAEEEGGVDPEGRERQQGAETTAHALHDSVAALQDRGSSGPAHAGIKPALTQAAQAATGGAAGDGQAVAAAFGEAGSAAAGEGEVVVGSGLPLSGLERALRGCKTLACLREAHKQPKHPQQFNFPHFYILGFAKCATTSLYHHLIQHPTVMAPSAKEPNFFTAHCEDDAHTCSLQEQETYVTSTLHLGIALQARLFMATFEGSVHYSLAGEWLAPQLRELMPWVKLVLSLREPISQAISMLKHNLDHDRTPSCYSSGSLYKCIRQKLEDPDERYTPRLQAWVDAFPREQLFVMQYENLTEPAATKRVLRDVKRFVGIDAKLPHDDLGLHNSRRDENDGWPLTRHEYTNLVDLARQDAAEVVALVRRHGFADADRWLSNWEEAWQSNMAACQAGPEGQCRVQLT